MRLCASLTKVANELETFYEDLAVARKDPNLSVEDAHMLVKRGPWQV